MQVNFRWCKFQQLQLLELHNIFALRQQVFIVEQQSIYTDIDGLDPASWHLLLETADKVLLGYARLRADRALGCYKFERILLAEPARGTGLAGQLIEQLLDKAAQLREYSLLKLSAQSHLQDFYAKWGFIAMGLEYDDGGILHRDMQRVL
ncbi:GNAT family N-acetyltransferase [Bowmanella denitrificans]|uniref:GNAT family N-acetyltransferase n=1 Tax=Bowmanella denitrificans TaxID=366582 RepID=UPI000C9B19CB|nr:GNAT family N-acetyltransferase [Bowmanella denitrificans]